MNLGFIQILKHNTKIQAAPRGHRHTPQQPLSTLVNQSRSPYHHHLITETRFLWKRLLVPRYCCNRVETEDLSSRLQLVTGSSLCSTAGTQCLQSLRDSKGSHVGGVGGGVTQSGKIVCACVYMSVYECVCDCGGPRDLAAINTWTLTNDRSNKAMKTVVLLWICILLFVC